MGEPKLRGLRYSQATEGGVILRGQFGKPRLKKAAKMAFRGHGFDLGVSGEWLTAVEDPSPASTSAGGDSIEELPSPLLACGLVDEELPNPRAVCGSMAVLASGLGEEFAFESQKRLQLIRAQA